MYISCHYIFQHKRLASVGARWILALGTEECSWIWMHNYASVKTGAKIRIRECPRGDCGHQGEDPADPGQGQSPLWSVCQPVQVSARYLLFTLFSSGCFIRHIDCWRSSFAHNSQHQFNAKKRKRRSLCLSHRLLSDLKVAAACLLHLFANLQCTFSSQSMQ